MYIVLPVNGYFFFFYICSLKRVQSIFAVRIDRFRDSDLRNVFEKLLVGVMIVLKRAIKFAKKPPMAPSMRPKGILGSNSVNNR